MRVFVIETDPGEIVFVNHDSLMDPKIVGSLGSAEVEGIVRDVANMLGGKVLGTAEIEVTPL